METKTKYVYTVSEVADILGVTDGHVYRLIKQKEIPALKLGRVYRIPVKAFHHYLDMTPMKSQMEVVL